jgi:HK97 family phage major capsid protein
MTIEELKALIAAKQTRASQLEDLIKAEKDPVKLEALVTEAKTVSEDRNKAEVELGVSLRSAGLDAINSHPVPLSGSERETPESGMMHLDKRGALRLALGLAALKQKPSDLEQRALDTALTTTAVTYVAPSATVNGTNNAGVFIATNVILDLLNEQKKLTPILQDILFTNVKGLTVFPYRKSRSKAKAKSEGNGTGTASWEWGQLSGVKGWLQLNVDVSDEAVFLSAIDLGSYILSQMLEDLTYDWAAELIYGIGANDSDGNSHVSGIVNGLTAKTYAAGKELDGIAAGITSEESIYAKGAKLYVSRSLSNKILLTKDSNGDYIFQIVNNTVGVNTVVNVPCAIDDTLNDGDYVIGNISSYFKANLLSPLSSESKHDQNKHITSYNTSVFACTIAVPSAFVYGKLSA